MVLESIINPLKAEKSPWEMFFIGLVYSSVAIFLSLWIFKEYSSLIMVFLTVMACIPIIFNTLKLEEGKDLKKIKEIFLLKEHSKALLVFMMLFLGMTISFSLWHIFSSPNLNSVLFEVQTKTISDINGKITGDLSESLSVFFEILFNNLRVLFFCILFSLIYGFGAIFILAWNASVIGAAIGNFVRANLLSNYHHFFSLPLGLLRYMVHGIPEILGYFVGGLAGGIISIAIIRHDFKSSRFEKILLDSSDLVLISIGFLVLAALLEVMVTPLFF